MITSFLIHYYINKKYDHLNNQISKINLFFYFILASILAPAIFFTISPKIVSIYHFLGILQFSLIFYLIISLSFILTNKIFLKYNFILKVFLILSIFILNNYVAKKINEKDSLFIKEIRKFKIIYKIKIN